MQVSGRAEVSSVVRAVNAVGRSRICDRLLAMEADCAALHTHLQAIHAHASKIQDQRLAPGTNRRMVRELEVTDSHSNPSESDSEEKLSLWEKWVNEEHPNTFKHLLLAQDGGFSEVKDLYNAWRWIAAGIMILFVIYNMFSVILLDCHLIWFQDVAKHDIGVHSIKEIDGKFYISRQVTGWLVTDVLGLPSEQIPTSVRLLGYLELFGCLFYLSNGVFSGFNMYFDTGFKRWYHTQFLFWEVIPLLSVYSAMKLLKVIVPSIFISKLFEKITAIQEARNKTKPILKIICWIFEVIFCFIIGFDTFLMKLRMVSHYAKIPTENMEYLSILTMIVLPVIQFLVQTLGVVQLGPFVRNRLYLFIFGGEDAIMQERETEIMETWSALLAKRIWRECTPLQFCAVMTSFSDEDFQSLVLNENTQVKELEIGK